jgi:anti-sigma regulatory factor (Ser/Thr protein kinase)
MEQRENDDERSPGRLSAVRAELLLVVDHAAELAGFRRRVRALLRDQGLKRSEREAVVLATVEALTNALNACELEECRIEVKVSLVGDFICVEVRDADERFRGACLDLFAIPETSAEHGRGLYLMQALMESLEIVPRDQGTLVRMTKRLEAEGRADDCGGDAGNGADEAA